ncbi:hypothetical protein HMPREF9370_0260 [Neisseria wadsworthii 9715]|uniref:Uncharacterized protein n=1 Tax=Neisseria wadsworthii 9715 TaxID=1030841 RepID=G4CMF1_9NEIS|nr:hypothetical protein HMPREF9370_0260 [Neisseria wadsworthii 9715]
MKTVFEFKEICLSRASVWGCLLIFFSANAVFGITFDTGFFFYVIHRIGTDTEFLGYFEDGEMLVRVWLRQVC